jgi:hypothetical protein
MSWSFRRKSTVKRRVLAMLLTLAFPMSMSRGAPLGQNALALGSASGASGSTVSVPLNLANEDAVSGIELDILFDSAVASFAGGEVAARATGMAFAYAVLQSPYRVRVVMYFVGGGAIAAGTGTVANLGFQLVGGPGTATNLTPDAAELSDPNAQALPVTAAAGSLTVTGTPIPTGACCAPDGTCSLVVQAACTNGVWQGADTACTPNPCPQPPPPPPTGGCCNLTTSACQITTQADCAFSWLGADVACSAVTCPEPPPTGSCCLADGSCTVSVQAACTAAWTMSGTCAPNICPSPPDAEGACCAPQGTCTVTTRAACPESSQWHPEWLVCAPNPCPIPQGACCALDDTCTLTILVDCAPPATWRGASTICDPNPCPQPEPAEQASWGQLKNRYR